LIDKFSKIGRKYPNKVDSWLKIAYKMAIL
jgi:hypothetical protein